MKTEALLSINILLIFLIIASFFIGYAAQKNQASNPGTIILMLALIISIAFPFFLKPYLTKDYDLFEPINLVAFLYFLFFAIRSIVLLSNPMFLIANEEFTISDFNLALFYSIIGFLTLLLGYYSFIPKFITQKLPKLKILFSLRNNEYLIGSGNILIIIYVVGIIIRVLNMTIFGFQGSAFKASESPFDERLSYANLIVTFSTLSIYVFALYTIRSFILKKSYIIMTLMAISEIGYIFLGGWKVPFLHVLFVLLILYNYSSQKIRFKHAFALVILLIPLIIFIFPFIQMYRATTVTNLREISFSPGRLMGVASEVVTNIQYSAVNTAPRAVVNRMAGLDPLIILIMRLDSYQMGKTLVPIFTIPIPRILWDNKPILSTGYTFATQFLGWDPKYKSEAAITQMGEFYWNFGIVGIIVGMFLLGILYRSFYLYLIVKHRDSLSALFLYTFCLLCLLNIEGNIAVVIGKLINTLITTILILFWIIFLTNFLRKRIVL